MTWTAYIVMEYSIWFSPGTLVSSTNKTDHHNITEILLKVVLNTITLTPNISHWKLDGQIMVVFFGIFQFNSFLCKFGHRKNISPPFKVKWWWIRSTLWWGFLIIHYLFCFVSQFFVFHTSTHGVVDHYYTCS